MNPLFFLQKAIKSVMMLVFVTLLVFTPLRVSITPGLDGKLVPKVENQRALALVDVGILGSQALDASYNSSTGVLTLKITGTVLASLGALNTQKFVYKLPDELKSVLGDPYFKQNARIDFEAKWLLGSTSDNFFGSSLTLDPLAGTVTVVRNKSLDVSLLPAVTVTLTINLTDLGLTILPPSPNGNLEFYGIAAKDTLINLDVLVIEGSHDEIELMYYLLPQQ